ncbi:hypothetical protein MBLNU230_g8104t1 [Neophaeotheca triangularis]
MVSFASESETLDDMLTLPAQGRAPVARMSELQPETGPPYDGYHPTDQHGQNAVKTEAASDHVNSKPTMPAPSTTTHNTAIHPAVLSSTYTTQYQLPSTNQHQQTHAAIPKEPLPTTKAIAHHQKKIERAPDRQLSPTRIRPEKLHHMSNQAKIASDSMPCGFPKRDCDIAIGLVNSPTYLVMLPFGGFVEKANGYPRDGEAGNG